MATSRNQRKPATPSRRTILSTIAAYELALNAERSNPDLAGFLRGYVTGLSPAESLILSDYRHVRNQLAKELPEAFVEQGGRI